MTIDLRPEQSLVSGNLTLAAMLQVSRRRNRSIRWLIRGSSCSRSNANRAAHTNLRQGRELCTRLGRRNECDCCSKQHIKLYRLIASSGALPLQTLLALAIARQQVGITHLHSGERSLNSFLAQSSSMRDSCWRTQYSNFIRSKYQHDLPFTLALVFSVCV